MWKQRLIHLGFGWLLSLLGASLLAPAWAGSVPAGGGSGVTTSGSSSLTTGAAPIAEGPVIPTSANIDVDLTTGELQLTAAARQSLDAATTQLLKELRSQQPELAAALARPLTIEMTATVEDVRLDSGFAIRQGTPARAAENMAAAITAGKAVRLFAADSILSFSQPQTSGNVMSTQLTYTEAPGVRPVRLTLQGPLDNVANAAAFAATVVAAGGSINQVGPYLDLALRGVPYGDVVALVNATAGLLTSGEEEDEVSATQLNEAILAYNRLLASVDDATLVALNQDPAFVALGNTLRQLRAAIDAA